MHGGVSAQFNKNLIIHEKDISRINGSRSGFNHLG